MEKLSRVSRRNRCPVCNHDSYCSYNAEIILCKRSEDSPRARAKDGSAVFKWEDIGKTPVHIRQLTPQNTDQKPQREIDAELTHEFYAALLKYSPALPGPIAVEHPTIGLRARGFTRFEGFGYLPGLRRERLSLLRQILARTDIRVDRGGVPGISKSCRGWELGFPFDMPEAIIIPSRSTEGKIRGLYLRYMGKAGEKFKYRWLTSTGLHEGTKSLTPVHYVWPDSEQPVILTEGALKAEVIALHKPGRRIIGLPGINIGIPEAVEAVKDADLIIAFDQDDPAKIRTIQAVKLAKDSLLQQRLETKSPTAKTYIARWSGNAKGVDDALHTGTPVSLARILH